VRAGPRRRGEDAAGGIGRAGHAQVHGGGAAGQPVQLGEFLPRPVEADLEALGFAGPAFVFGFADAGGQVVADAFQPRPLSWVDAEEGAPDTAFSELTV